MDSLSTGFQSLLAEIVVFLPKVIVALVVFVLALLAAGLVSRMLRRALARRQADVETSLLVTQIARWTVIILGAVVALQQVNFDLTAFLTGLGVLGFTVGFALQDVSKNFVSGMLLLLQQPFEIGDAIEVAGFAGTVQTIDLRATELLTFDGIYVLIPNGDVFTSAILNYGRATKRRLDIAIGVAADSDLNQVARVAEAAVAAIPGVSTDPAPKVVFSNFGESTIDFTLYYWAELDQVGFLDAKDAGVRAIKVAFEEANIVMPFPTRTVRVEEMGS